MDESAANHVLALLREAQEHGIGLAFEPDLDAAGEDAGWTISYIIHDWPAVTSQSGFPGDRLASAYDLETACAAALKPLREMGDSYRRHLEWRAGER
jgi:hypothetical protein